MLVVAVAEVPTTMLLGLAARVAVAMEHKTTILTAQQEQQIWVVVVAVAVVPVRAAAQVVLVS
jgi:hypothetical protein